MIKQLQNTARLFLAGLFLSVALPASAGVQVSPTGLTLTEQRPVGILTLANHRERDTSFQVQIYAWKQNNGDDVLNETRELLVSPAVFQLEARENQTVRVALRRSFPTEQEASYRAIFREIPPSTKDSSGIGLTFALEMSVPVFVTPATANEANMQWQASLDEHSGQLLVQATNSGGRHIQFTRLALYDGSETLIAPPRSQLTYLLPGTTNEWKLTPEIALAPGSVVTIQVKSGRQAVNENIRVE